MHSRRVRDWQIHTDDEKNGADRGRGIHKPDARFAVTSSCTGMSVASDPD